MILRHPQHVVQQGIADGRPRQETAVRHGRHGAGRADDHVEPPRIEGTRYFYRDGVELTEEHEAFEELSGR